jgi:hypothetical protein
VGLRHRPLSGWVHIKLAAVSICVLAVGLSCPAEKAQAPQTTTADRIDPPANHDQAVLFFTGSTLGALKPCGCSGGQLGGLEKRRSVFDEAPKANRLIIDTGALVQSDREQDLIKFRILFEAFGLLGYDVVHLSPGDMGTAGNLGILSEGEKPFAIVAASGQGTGVSRSFAKKLTAGKSTISVNVAALDAQTGRIDRVAALFPDGDAAGTIKVLILEGCEGRAPQDVLSAIPPSVDCVVWPSDADEPRLLSQPGANPLVFTVGRFGRHICRIGVTIPPQEGRPALRFVDVPVSEKLPRTEALVRLYQSYQQLVRDGKLLERYPRIPLPQGATFVGSKACAKCHEYEYGKWSTQRHAGAFATLQKVGSDRDPECVTCHVVGMEYAGGFVTQEQTPHLQDVGCEVCHGPGSEHLLTAGQAKTTTTEPRLPCLKCHTPEHSGEYASHKEEYMKKIVHWREP